MRGTLIIIKERTMETKVKQRKQFEDLMPVECETLRTKN